MRKILAVVMSLLIAVSVFFAVPKSNDSSIKVDRGVILVCLDNEHQQMNGFGASACWWSKDVGGWDNIDDIMALLYDDENGIGLNIYRYNLGAGSDKDGLNYRNDRYAECFLNEDGTYDWGKDYNSQLALASAKKFAGDDMRLTLFCNSAPIYFTKNGYAIADNYWWDQNIEEDKYEAFADYGYECVNYFQNQGYRVVDISPINEPFGHWCRDSAEVKDENGETVLKEDGEPLIEYYDWAGQEGSFYFREGVRDITTAFFNRFENTEVAEKGCVVSTMEANDMANNEGSLYVYLEGLFGTGKDFRKHNKTIRNNIDTITMHSYFSTLEGKKEVADFLKTEYKGKYKVAQTEYCQMDIDRCNGLEALYAKEGMTSGLTIDYALALAEVMYDDLTVFDAVEWDWWTAVAYGGYTDGLVYVDKDTHQLEASKRLYALGNFSKFTQEGSVRIDAVTGTPALKTIAFKNPDNSVSIIFINKYSREQSTSINLDNDVAYNCKAYVTDEERNLEELDGVDSASDTITIPAKSITTVVLKPAQ